jgi:hypothetical protein
MTTPTSSLFPNASALTNVLASALTAPAQIAAALAGALTKNATAGGCSSGPSLGLSTGCCEIPPPCWEPQPVGTCRLQVSPGGTGTIRVQVSNCGWTRQLVSITALGRLAGLMTFLPTTMLIGPQQRATFRVNISVPAAALLGASVTGPLIIRGCRDYFARIELTVADCVAGGCNCCDVVVNDCADQIHHWYDHFYCPRPCNTVREPVYRPIDRKVGNG